MISVPTPFMAHGLIYLASGYLRPTKPIVALKPGAAGDVSAHHIAWRNENGAPYLPTPIVYGEYLYVLSHRGILSVYAARTGQAKYEQRLGTNAFASSLVAANGHIYAASEDGEVRAESRRNIRTSDHESHGRTHYGNTGAHARRHVDNSGARSSLWYSSAVTDKAFAQATIGRSAHSLWQALES